MHGIISNNVTISHFWPRDAYKARGFNINSVIYCDIYISQTKILVPEILLENTNSCKLLYLHSNSYRSTVKVRVCMYSGLHLMLHLNLFNFYKNTSKSEDTYQHFDHAKYGIACKILNYSFKIIENNAK